MNWWGTADGAGNLPGMVDSGGNPNQPADITVVPDEVRAVGQFVADIARNLRSGLDSASSEVEAVLSDGWRGDASDEFSGGWTELRDGGIKILQALEGMAAELGVQAGTYETTDDHNSQQFPSLNL